MSLLTAEEKQGLLVQVTRQAVRLETRDVYDLSNEKERFESFLRLGKRDPEEARIPSSWRTFVRSAVAAGISIKRARVISEPVSDYIRFEHAGTHLNVAAGEEVRWLPRKKAMGIAIPANDFWLLDTCTVLINYFSGDGSAAEQVLIRDPAISAFCESSFETVWDAAVPHSEYHVA